MTQEEVDFEPVVIPMASGSDLADMIDRVIFNAPATIVYWKDRSRTVVQTRGGERYDPEKGLAMAIVKRIAGNSGNYNEIFKRFRPVEEGVQNG